MPKIIDPALEPLPTLRDPDNLVYFRTEVGGLVMGGYERTPAPWALDGIPDGFEAKLLPEEWDRMQELFENAIWGLIEIVGARTDEGKNEERVSVRLDEDDPGAALVDLLNEVIYLLDLQQARIAGLSVERADSVIEARIRWRPDPDPPEGTELKAATFHQLSLEKRDYGFDATVYFDV